MPHQKNNIAVTLLIDSTIHPKRLCQISRGTDIDVGSSREHHAIDQDSLADRSLNHCSDRQVTLWVDLVLSLSPTVMGLIGRYELV